MTLKTLVTGAAAAALVGGAAAGVTSIASSSLSAAPVVQPVVFGAPLPLEPVAPCGADAAQLRSVIDGLAAPGVGFHSGKSDLVEGGIGIIEGRTADRLLMNAYANGSLPVAFDISAPVCNPNNTATATISAAGRSQPVTFVPGGRFGWQLSRGSATAVLSAFS